MGWFRRTKKDEPVVLPEHHEPVPEEAVLTTAGVPLSHESVIVLARLDGLADRLETAVRRLERQVGEEGDEDA